MTLEEKLRAGHFVLTAEVTPPVSADHLAAEAVSPAFLEYLREIRPELIDSAG